MKEVRQCEDTATHVPHQYKFPAFVSMEEEDYQSCIYMITEGATGHEIIDKDHFRIVVAVTNQRDQMELGKHLDLELNSRAPG